MTVAYFHISRRPSSGGILRITDHFGPTFMCFPGPRQPGEIRKAAFSFPAESTRSRSLAEGRDYYEIPVRILRPVELAEVQALVDQLRTQQKTLDLGYWYEVHAD